MTFSRRQFLASTSTTLLASALPGTLSSVRAEESRKSAPEIAVFTKSFQEWPLEKVCEKFAALGVTGLDLTVRPQGHVLPDEIGKKLPLAQKIATQHGLKIVQITSNVTQPDEYGQTLFRVAGELGIRKIKLGYYRSQKHQPLQPQLSEVKQKLSSLVDLAQRHQVLPCVHIHSGAYLPSHGTLLYLLLQEFDPAVIGAYVDTLHMSLEGGSGGWQQGLDLLAPWIQLCAVKNYLLVKKDRDKFQQQRWGWKTCALADGISPLPEFVLALQKLNYAGPYSLHSEYHPELTTDECYTQTAADLAYFNKLLAQ